MNEKEIVMFNYTIHPKKPIRSITRLGLIRVPKTYLLSKDEVKECLPLATVYRHFYNSNERVSLMNLDRLHNETFMTEEEYKKFLASKEEEDFEAFVTCKEDPEEVIENSLSDTDSRGSVVASIPEEKAEEVVVPEVVEEENSVSSIPEEKVEEVKEEELDTAQNNTEAEEVEPEFVEKVDDADVVEDTVDEEAKDSEELSVEKIDDELELVEESTEEVVEEVKIENNHINKHSKTTVNYNKKKK